MMPITEDIVGDLHALPASAVQQVAAYVHQLRVKADIDRQRAFDATFGSMTQDEATEFQRVIDEGCERIESLNELVRA